MGKMYPATPSFKHVIRPDGTLRVVTKAPIEAVEGELVLLLDNMHQPGLWFYDFGLRQFVEYTSAQLRDRHAARAKVAKGAATGERNKRKRLKALVEGMEGDVKEAFELVLQLARLKP